MKIIGITGGVGTGKTQVLEYLNDRYGATICIADDVAKKLEKKGTTCFDMVVEHFGPEILTEKGDLDRDKLSAIVFSDPNELRILNRIVHPAVKEEILKEIVREQRKNTNLFIIEAAVLIEDHYDEICDEVWYIYSDESTRKNRLKYTRGYTPGRIENIFNSQMSKEDYMENSDRVIDNSGAFVETMQQLDDIMKDL